MNFYELLGVQQTASADEIKKAYKAAALENHPDKQGGSLERMKEINEAYDTLKDPIKKSNYDYKISPGNNTWWAYGQQKPKPETNKYYDDLMDEFLAKTHQKNPDIYIRYNISIIDQINGCIANVLVQTSFGSTRVNFNIPPGTANPSTFVITNQDLPQDPTMKQGRLVVIVSVYSTSFKTQEHTFDLETEVKINTLESILGSEKDIRTPCGKTLKVRIKSGTMNNDLLRIPGYGLSKGVGFRGDLLIRVYCSSVKLTDEQLTDLREFLIQKQIIEL